MTLAHPFERLPVGSLHTWFVPLFAGTLASGFVLLLLIDSPQLLGQLYEVATATSADAAAQHVASWSATDRVRIAFAGGFDFLFGLLWTSLFAVACVWGSRVYRSRGLQLLGRVLAWLCWIGYGLDFPENYAYVAAVHGSVADPWPLVGAVALYARFALFFVLDAYVSLAVATRWIRGAGD